MTESFKNYLETIRATPDHLEHGLRFYLAKQTDYLSPEEMRDQMIAASSEGKDVELAIQKLEQDPETLESIAKQFFVDEWNDVEKRPLIQEAIEGAKKQLPVIEITAVTITAMYGMYLLATRNRKKITKKKKPDGSETTTEEFHDPAKWFSGPVELLRLWVKGDAAQEKRESSAGDDQQ
jgi:hypothetical protein